MPNTFTLYGAAGSSSTDRVQLTLAEGKFTDYDFVAVDLTKGEQRVSCILSTTPRSIRVTVCLQGPAHIARNPYGRVPVLVMSNGFTLYESRVIGKYLAVRYGFTNLLPPPTDLEATARFEQAKSVEMCHFSDPVGKLSWETFVKPVMGLVTDEEVVATARKALEKHFDICNDLLGKPGQEYMAGPTFSLVDINYIPNVARMFDRGHGDIVMSRANVKGWWERCMARPATAKFVDEMPKFDDIMKNIEAAKAASK